MNTLQQLTAMLGLSQLTFENVSRTNSQCLKWQSCLWLCRFLLGQLPVLQCPSSVRIVSVVTNFTYGCEGTGSLNCSNAAKNCVCTAVKVFSNPRRIFVPSLIFMGRKMSTLAIFSSSNLDSFITWKSLIRKPCILSSVSIGSSRNNYVSVQSLIIKWKGARPIDFVKQLHLEEAQTHVT